MPRIEGTFSIRTPTIFLALCSRIAAIAAAFVVVYREYRDRIGSSLIAASRALMPRMERTFAALVVLYREYRNRLGSSLIAARRAITPQPERTFSIRTVMLILTLGSGIVAIAAALVVGWLSYREYRDRIGGSLIAASRAIMVSVDGELDQALAFVNGLSTSPNFVMGDFAALHCKRGKHLLLTVTF